LLLLSKQEEDLERRESAPTQSTKQFLTFRNDGFIQNIMDAVLGLGGNPNAIIERFFRLSTRFPRLFVEPYY
jgi:hypothetical protein